MMPLSVYCEYAGPLPTGNRRQKYRSDFPVHLSYFYTSSQNWYGCHRMLKKSSKLECALKCTMNVACRSIYYGDVDRRCVRMMYADARLPSTSMSTTAKWKRYAKTSDSPKTQLNLPFMMFLNNRMCCTRPPHANECISRNQSKAVLSTCSDCPSNYSHILPDLCIVNLEQTNSFCSAAEKCANFGATHGHLAFLVGRNARQISPFLNDCTNLWLGLNVLLKPANPSSIGWRDVDPRTPQYTTKRGEISWQLGKTRASNAIIIMEGITRTMYGCSTTCDSMPLSAICEYGAPLPTGRRQQHYRSDFPVRLDDFIQTDPNAFGCYQEVEAFSTLDCARKCTMDVACRSIYYGEADRRCVHMMYADARLPSSITKKEAGWKRYAKTSYKHVHVPVDSFCSTSSLEHLFKLPLTVSANRLGFMCCKAGRGRFLLRCL
ncbi:hypothetical protein CSKR_109388 [Clonorchis sinensis]|uniref:Apple domain-containing protein n=1 Tax=Clonorchis sinensis TaxID=79923 RepID=A0A3R7FQ01_CLOSI|nr:hypothetical protein CSKR_109388 [Clonorchis sinensis]